VRPAQIVEAVLFASDAPLRAEEIARADQALDEDVVEEAIQEIQRDYDDGERAYQIREVAGGYQIMTRPEFAPYLERFDTVPRPSRLSGPALETLAIIAYRQPIGRVEVEYIRGVGSSGVIRTLQDRALIEVVGRAEGLGRPLLYGTTSRFLEHFGFRSLEDLPRPEELPVVLRERTPLGTDDRDGGEVHPLDEPERVHVEPAAVNAEGRVVEAEEARTAPGHGLLSEDGSRPLEELSDPVELPNPDTQLEGFHG
jgi:segregation and condensation protein B